MKPSAQSLKAEPDLATPSQRGHFKPRLAELLAALRLDISYVRGAGDSLYYCDAAGREIEVLDGVGGYGSLLLGHAHPELVAEAQRLLASGRPMHSQGSARVYASRLAAELARRAGGDYCVVFGNSGTEAVEAAMKHAMLETGARTFLALERAFHGKTLGALQLTANPAYREPFALDSVNVVRVPANDLEQLEAAFARTPDLAGFVFEPVLGEGGIRPLQAEFVQRAAAWCAQRKVPLIADECQTGLGRTGTFLACEALGVRPDYVILSKALGGGLAKISALLVARARYRDDFDLLHTSTYAEDDYSCAIALKALALIDEPLLAGVRRKGAALLEGLRGLARTYPAVVADVRGAGLMLAVEFHRPTRSNSFLLRFLNAQEELGYVITGYLLHTHRVRVAPTLSERQTLRLEPSALIGEAGIRRILAALEDVCQRVAAADARRLTEHLSHGPTPDGTTALVRRQPKLVAHDEARFQQRQRHVPEVKVAWLCHMVDANGLALLEPSYAESSYAERERALERLVPHLAPVVLSAADVRSTAGRMLRLYPILLPFTSAWIKQRIERRHLTQPRLLVQQGIDLARALDCRVVSLGQYTSIATCAGTRLKARGMGITTGNSYAIALAVQAIERAQRETGRGAAESVLVIVGAAGNIGRTCAQILGPRYRRTILIGSRKPGSMLRLQALAKTIPHAVATTDLGAIGEGDVVIAAINAVDAPVAAESFAPHTIFCDLSVPASVGRGAELARPDVLMIRGGIAALPFGEDLEILDFPLPAGRTYGCMAEAMLLGLEGIRDTAFTGSLTPEHVARVTAMAQRHGFQLADYRRAGLAGAEGKEPAHAVAF